LDRVVGSILPRIRQFVALSLDGAEFVPAAGALADAGGGGGLPWGTKNPSFCSRRVRSTMLYIHTPQSSAPVKKAPIKTAGQKNFGLGWSPFIDIG
jgi:hypothetical protein